MNQNKLTEFVWKLEIKELKSERSQCNSTSFVKLVVNADVLFLSDPLAKRDSTRCSTMTQKWQKFARRLQGCAVDSVCASHGYLCFIVSFIIRPFSCPNRKIQTSWMWVCVLPLTLTLPPVLLSDGSSFPHSSRVDGEDGDLWRGAG